MLTRDQMKVKAIMAMREIGLDPDVIGDFRDLEEVPCFYENGTIITSWQDKFINELISEHEQEYEDLVYAIIQTDTFTGVHYSMLVISNDEYCNKTLMKDIKNGYVLAYVYNEDCPEYSEFGTIGYLYSKNSGHLMRTA